MTILRGVLVLLLGIAAPALGIEPPRLLGFARVAAGSVDAAPTFLDGGFGKLADGGAPAEDNADAFAGEARLALDWEPGAGWGLFVHGVARQDAASRDDSSGSGLLEAFAERRFGDGEWHLWTFRAGQFFLPASRENVGPLWTSPYTLTLSAMNSWIAEEIRPTGLDLAYTRTFASDHRLHLAGTAFLGNDTSGTLIAWRGFSFHDRPTPTGRFVPLPPIEGFPKQSREGTKAFGSDLDGRPGFAGRIRWTAPDDRAVIQATAFLNRGDRDLHGEEYAWETDFRWLSVETALPARLRLLGEWGTGISRMGIPPPGQRSEAVVDILFDTFYLLLTREWRGGAIRTTARYDHFWVEDRDSTALDDNREKGRAWTLALMVPMGERWRAGVELLDLEADRPAAHRAGSPPLDGDSVRAELRYAF